MSGGWPQIRSPSKRGGRRATRLFRLLGYRMALPDALRDRGGHRRLNTTPAVAA